MKIKLVVLSVLLLIHSVSADSTGSTAASKTYIYSSLTEAHDTPFLLDNDVKRTLLQEPEGDPCSDCRTLRHAVYNETTRTWILNDSALDGGEVDIQCLVSCANASDTIMLPRNRILKPSGTITINKPLTVTGFHEGKLTGRGTYPAAENKTVISCPEESGGVIFNILNGGVTIADFEIRECSLEEDQSPIIIRNCERNTDGVRIHNGDFVNNTHSSQLVAIDITNSSSCSILEVTNVTFKDNKAVDNVAVIRLGSTPNMTDVRIEANKRTENEIEKEFLVFATSGTPSNGLTIDRLVLARNQMPILKASSSAIEILNSNFTGNVAGTEDANMFQFFSATEIVVRNCTFENNTGEGRGMITLESDQYIEIHDSIFAYNSRFGSVIFSAGSELKVRESNFTSNHGDLSGGVIHLENSNASLKRTFFKENRSGQNGGSVFAINDSTLTVEDSEFINNTALEGGCFYIENSNLSIAESTFHRNKADVDGGAIRVEQGGCVCKDSVFEDNNSMDEGGAIHIENATYVIMQSVKFTSNDAAFGSVVRIDKSRTNVTLKDVHFRGGVVELTGAALYIDTTNITIEGATFTNNRAPYGGAIYAQAFNITIKDAKFLNNIASVMGGAISGDNGNITLEKTTFKGNHAYLGGALHFYNTTVNASDIVFLNNSASEGGGLQCKNSNVTIRPRKEVKFRIPDSEQVDSDTSFGIYARNNTGIDNGGVIDAKDSNISIAYGNFSNNTAPEGGAIQATNSELAFVNISDSWFTENLADVRGGALAVRSANEGNVWMNLSFSNFSRCIADQGGAIFLTSVNALIQGCTFVNNTAMEGGAALFQKNIRVTWKDNNVSTSDDIGITLKNCLLEKNRARVHGGALILRGEAIATRSSDTSDEGSVVLDFAEGGFNVFFEYVNLTENRARRKGGGVHGEAVALDIQNVKVTNNTASQGGGVYLMRSTADIRNSTVSSNQAESCGGGIMMARQSNGTIVETNFTDNRIKGGGGEGGGLSLSGSNITAENVIFEQNNATYGGGASLVPGSQRNAPVEKMELDSRFLCFECIFLNNNASASGGALNVKSQYREDPEVTRLEDCQFESNKATIFGGGVHFERPSNQTECTSWESCSHLVILNSSFVNNTAERSGSSLLSNAWDGVLLNCSRSTDNNSPLRYISISRTSNHSTSQPELSPQCIDAGNRTKETPPLVSSYARECIIKDVKDGNWSEINSNSIQINETVPGERLPDILIECYDEFGQFARSDYDDRFTATLKSKEVGYLEGIFVTDLTNGTGNITGVRNPPNKSFEGSYCYGLEISFSLAYVEPISVLINVRECRVNEQKDNESGECKPCDATQYNFNPMDDTCKHCDDTLDCSGNYVFPKDNHWHSSPCHVPSQKCLTAKACNKTASLWEKITVIEFGNLSAALNKSSCEFSNASLVEYQKLQCNEGYEGVLCGSCTEDYGRSLSFECTECNGPVFGVLILVSVCVWLAGIAAITIHGSKTIEERLSVIRKRLYDIASRRRFRLEESIPEETEIETQEENVENENTKTKPPKSNTLKRSLTGASRSTVASYWIGHNLPTTSVTATVETPEEINNLKLAQLAKWKLCEVFKVTMNFLQAISVAAAINVEWTTYMLAMFKASAFAGGASTALVTRAIQCLPWWNGTRYATYAGLVSSILVPTFVILCIVANFAAVAYKTSNGMYYFVKRSALATLAICYFSYLSVTKVAVMVFYCIGVRTDNDFSSDHKTNYWALDTSIECADRDHKDLMVFGGILFALFSVGFPLISAFILVLCRKGSGFRDPQWMTDILGFLYRAYKREFVYWESTVMLRKALLSAIAVFSYHLGGHSQGLLASCILSVCLFFQAIYKPYRVEFDTVNNIESLSLLISGITFTLAQFFMKDRTNEAVKVGLSVFLMVLIIGFLVYLFLRMLICLIDVFKTDLRVIGALADENENSWSIVGTWITSRLGLSERSNGDDDDDDLGDVELGSLRSVNSAGNMSETST